MDIHKPTFELSDPIHEPIAVSKRDPFDFQDRSGDPIQYGMGMVQYRATPDITLQNPHPHECLPLTPRSVSEGDTSVTERIAVTLSQLKESN